MTETNPVQTASIQFFTVVARNYMAHAFVLGDSVLRHHPEATFSIFLMDDIDRSWKAVIENQGFRTIYPEAIAVEDYRKFVFQYKVTEASTGVKPFVFRALFDGGTDKVVYLDPDILCFRRLDEVLTALDRYDIVLTPHICSPAPEDHFPGEKGLMSSGVFNLGFIGLRRSETSARFLNWWSAHLKYECVAEPDGGLFVDQKWIDLVPGCFDGVYILRSRAYNIAYWNFHERALEEHDDCLFERQSGEHVAFIHFSGITLDDLDSICKYVDRNPFGNGANKRRYTLSARPDLVGPFTLYKQLLLSANVESFSKIPYAHATYDNGEPVSDLERVLYRTSETWRNNDGNPFTVGSGSFRNACRRAGVRVGVARDVKCSAQELVNKYGGYMRLIQFFLRCLLLSLGPQKYRQFAKYMRHQFLPSNHEFLLSASAAKDGSANVANPGSRRTQLAPEKRSPQEISARHEQGTGGSLEKID